jgi:hypothetical protein
VRLGARSEADGIEVAQRIERALHPIAVLGKVARDLEIRIALCHPDRPWEVRQKRHIGHCSLHTRIEPGDGEADAAALAAADHRDPRRIDLGAAPDGLDRAYPIGEHASVEIGTRIDDAAGHVPGNGGIRADRIGRVATGPA